MATATLPWTQPQPLPARVDLGPGLEPEPLTAALGRLCALPGVRAVVAFGSRGRGEASSESDLDLAVICAEPRLTPLQKRSRWRQCRQAIGLLGRDVEARYEEGPFPLPAPRQELLNAIEQLLAACQATVEAEGRGEQARRAPNGLRSDHACDPSQVRRPRSAPRLSE